jgi:hypothetical protein
MRALILSLFIFGPLLLILAAWIKLYMARKKSRPSTPALTALIIASANAAFAVRNFLHHHFKPGPYLPPWKDSEILNFGLLFLTAPIGMIVAFIAALRGAQGWVTWMVEISSLLLLTIGFFAAASI